MDWKAQRPAIEIAAEWIAAACVGGATAFATSALVPPGATLLAAPAAAMLGAVAALFAMGRVDRRARPALGGFVPAEFDLEANVLTLDEPIEADDCLLLDDPIPALRDELRVVRLFAVPPMAADAAPLPAPGEMAARIEDFLGGTWTITVPADPLFLNPPAATDASAALHAALADIRRSLRQA